MATTIIAAEESTTAERIDAFEQKNGLTLPRDYRDFLLRYNGGQPQPNACWIPSLEDHVLVQNLYGISSHDVLDLQFWMDEFGDEMPTGFVIIADDPGGAMFILGTLPENRGVYFWDHQHFFPGSSEENGNTFFLADTFTAWIDSLRKLPQT